MKDEGYLQSVTALGEGDTLHLGLHDVAVVLAAVDVVVAPHLVQQRGPHGAQVLSVQHVVPGAEREEREERTRE